MAPTTQLPPVPTKDYVTFSVNGETHTVGGEISSDVTLVDYLRNYLRLSGTKYMCREGGCGVCCVTVVKCPGGPVVSVNSCMVAITSCQDWAITTIEDIGNRKKGYHILQKTLAKFNGTQCGYCTPAWIQNMYSLLQNGNKPTMADIEKSFGSNICRCTGYRPILEAFKKFASDAPAESRITDIEDLQMCKTTIEDLQMCKTTGKPCKSKCGKETEPCYKNRGVENDEFDVINEFDDWCLVTEEEVKESNVIAIQLKDNKWWFKVCDLKSIFDILNVHGYDSYMLVYGNTAKGAYPRDDQARVNIDITTVPELKCCKFDQNLIVGVGVTLNELLEVFKTVAKEQYFGYLNKFVEHINLVASIPIRHLGSLGGNLMIKHEHNEFPSDLFLLLETVDAYLTIYTSHGVTKKLSMQQFLREDMTGKIIVDAMLPPICDTCKFISYKVMPRSQNAHAIVNAGFLYKLAPDNTVTEARITFGGLSPIFIRAENTEKYLVGKPLFSNTTLQGAMNILDTELVIGYEPPETSVAYRRQLSLSLFYKGLLTLCPKNILNPRHLSATTKIHETRPVSQGRQIFYTNPKLWPLNQPIEKVDALIQCAGETKYTDDIQPQPREVYAAFVMSDVAVGDIVNIDTSLAKDNSGIIAIYIASDIPGENSFIPGGSPFFEANEEVLASQKVSYFNQPIAIVVAKSQHLANTTAKLVKATYTNRKRPTTDIKQAKNDASRLRIHTSKPATEKGTDVVRTITGENTIYSQLHVTMENISCVTIPTEEGLECHITSQWLDGCHLQISKALNMDESKIDVYARRLGGAYGLKISRSNQVAVACSLVSNKLNLPCRFVVPLTTCTRAVGKRYPCHAEYEVAVNAEGVIQSNKYKQYEDSGFMYDEKITMLGADAYNNCYTNTKWDLELYDAQTDTAKNTWCRSPGTLESIALAEHLVERIATELNLCPWAVRIANVDPKYNAIIQMAEDLKITSNYEQRKAAVDKFNCENRWRKRGIRCSFARWTPVGSSILEINISVYYGDGSVVITHGGVEMGQGINTKAVQICAYILKIPVEKIQVKGNNTIIAPNCFATGGSLGSQNVGLGVKRCCEALLERLEPIRNQMDNPKWLELIKKAYAMGVDLQAHNYVNSSDVFEFQIYGVAVAEVELDVLTGESQIRRVDILQDVGQSVSPEIDVGQVEGAFLMGQGYWTSEDLVYDRYTGELLSDRTWSYHVPLATDIPQDWRIAFRENSYSDPRILGAKGTGEPPMCLAVVIAFALRAAVSASLKEIGIPSTTWHKMGPVNSREGQPGIGSTKRRFLFLTDLKMKDIDWFSTKLFHKIKKNPEELVFSFAIL